MLQQVQCMVSIKTTFQESDDSEEQAQFVYKKTNELMAHTWSHLYKILPTGFGFLQFMVRGTRYGTFQIL